MDTLEYFVPEHIYFGSDAMKQLYNNIIEKDVIAIFAGCGVHIPCSCCPHSINVFIPESAEIIIHRRNSIDIPDGISKQVTAITCMDCDGMDILAENIKYNLAISKYQRKCYVTKDDIEHLENRFNCKFGTMKVMPYMATNDSRLAIQEFVELKRA